jgi:ubiquinone/menaquinone biosynthesis C-methylase UbiE
VPLKRFNTLQDEYFDVSKRMHEASSIQEKMTLLNELQRILKESKDVLDEIHKKNASEATRFNAAN